MLQNKLARSVKKYVQYQSLDRQILSNTLSTISEKLPETAIFGGMLREFSLGHAKTFSSDIDLVSIASSNEIFQAIKHFEPTRNKFGGYRFYVEKQLYDIWSFDDTWAFREGLVKGRSFVDLFNTTFFNLDSAIYHLTSNECYTSDKYQEWIEHSFLELNLADNPSPINMTYRAINMAIRKKLSIGPKLASYLICNQPNDLNNNLVIKMFLNGLEKHLNNNQQENYTFQPQASLLSN